MKRTFRLLTWFTTVTILVFSLTAAVAVPILSRSWYVYQVETLDLVEETGYSQEVILESYDAVMDYLLRDAPFSTGALPHSEAGAAHFADCKPLFQLDLKLAAFSGGVLLVLLALAILLPGIRGRFSFSPALGALALTVVLVLILGGWALWDFNSLFTAFHHVCFPGKSNWVFHAASGPIIRLLPELFWARTAGLCAGGMLAIQVLLVLLYALLHRLLAPKNVYEALRSGWTAD